MRRAPTELLRLGSGFVRRYLLTTQRFPDDDPRNDAAREHYDRTKTTSSSQCWRRPGRERSRRRGETTFDHPSTACRQTGSTPTPTYL